MLQQQSDKPHTLPGPSASNRNQPETTSQELWMQAISRTIVRFAIIIAVIIGLVYSLGRLRTLFFYLIVSAIFAYIMRPMATWLAKNVGFVMIHDALANLFYRKKPGTIQPARHHLNMHVRRAIATTYVLVFLIAAMYFSVREMTRPFVAEVTNVTKNWNTGNSEDLKAKFDKLSGDARSWYESHISADTRQRIADSFDTGDNDPLAPVKTVGSEVGHKAAELAHNVVEIVLLPVLAFYFALDSKKLKHELVGALPRSRRKEVSRMIHEFNEIMHSFVVGQAILCTLAGVFIGIVLALLHVKYAIMLGLLAGFTRAIPIVGPIVGGIPIILLCLVTQGPGTAIAVLILFTFMHFAESKVIMPMLIGERMHLHPVVIIIVLLIGQEFGGLIGMFFAAPVAALLRVIIRRYWLHCHRGIPAAHSMSNNGLISGGDC
jgi:predicted PurR-regulated permease PerM